jgi:hypothetical protein
MQCCGTVMICCGSDSDFGKVLVPVPDPDNIEQFSEKTKKIPKILPFQCQKQLISQKVGLSFFIFDFFIILHPYPNPDPEP